MPKLDFFKELKRRNVYRVAITYAVVAWVILQIVSVIAPIIEAPIWVSKVVLIILMAGFPVALILAWAFEMSPEGIIRTPTEGLEKEPGSDAEKKLFAGKYVLGFLILFIIGQFLFNTYSSKEPSVQPTFEKSIAVLPFTNESPNEENVYFCNGVMQSIINHLSKIEEIRVIPRTSVEQFRNGNSSTAIIEQELKVSYILQGSVQRIGQRAIIYANLIDAKNERNIWSMTYDRGLQDLFAVQAEICSELLIEKKFRESIPIFQKWENLIIEESEDNWQSHETWKRYGMALIETGQVNQGREMMDKAIESYRNIIDLGRFNDINAMYSLAGVYAYLQEFDLAFYWLERLEDQNGWRKEANLVIWMQRDIFIDNLREFERFKIIQSRALNQQAEIQKSVRDLLP